MDWVTLLDRYGWPTVIVIALVVGGMKGVYVWGQNYRQVCAERDLYRDMVITSLGALEEAVKIVREMRERR